MQKPAVYTVLTLFLFINTLSDLKQKKISLLSCAFFAAVGIGLFFTGEEKDFLSLAGGIFCGIYLLLFSVLTKEAIGYGDGLVVMVTGIFLGGGKTVFILMEGLILASFVGIIRICQKKAGKKSEMPFVPFLTISYMFFLTAEWIIGKEF